MVGGWVSWEPTQWPLIQVLGQLVGAEEEALREERMGSGSKGSRLNSRASGGSSLPGTHSPARSAPRMLPLASLSPPGRIRTQWGQFVPHRG